MNLRTESVRERGMVSIPSVWFLASLVIGAIVGLAVAMPTDTPWLGIVAGLGAMLIVWIIFGIVYYYADFTRYMNLRRM